MRHQGFLASANQPRFRWSLISQFSVPKSGQQQCLVNCMAMFCRVMGGCSWAVGGFWFVLIVWPGLKSLLGPAVLCKLKSAWPEGQQPSSGNDWPSQPTALEKLVYCKTYLLRHREKAILHLITPIWLQKHRSSPFMRKQSKQARDNCTFLFLKISPDILWKSCVAGVRRHTRELCEYTCYRNRDSRKAEHGVPL